MIDEPATPTDDPPTEAPEKDEQHVPYERFQKVNAQAKEAKAAAASAAKQIADLKAQMDERESAGLPELDRERKRAEQLEKRAEEADKRAADAESRIQKSERKGWITAAAQAQNFADPSDAAAFVNLDDIEDEKDAERAVKRLAGQKKHLLKAEEPTLPGRVLKDGQQTPSVTPKPGATKVDMNAEAQYVATALEQFRKGRQAA